MVLQASLCLAVVGGALDSISEHALVLGSVGRQGDGGLLHYIVVFCSELSRNARARLFPWRMGHLVHLTPNSRTNLLQHDLRRKQF